MPILTNTLITAGMLGVWYAFLAVTVISARYRHHVSLGDGGIPELQARGVRFIACMQSIGRLADELSASRREDGGAIRKALVEGLLPGVLTVPAMVVAANRAQESGLTYVYASA